MEKSKTEIVADTVTDFIIVMIDDWIRKKTEQLDFEIEEELYQLIYKKLSEALAASYKMVYEKDKI